MARALVGWAIAAFVGIGVAITAGPALGQGAIQKCVGADNRIVYQDAPCPANAAPAAQIPRDKRVADPVAVERAAMESERARDMRLSRLAAEEKRMLDARAEEERREARERLARDEARAEEAHKAAMESPSYYGYGYYGGAVPSAQIVREAIRERAVPRPTPLPSRSGTTR